MRNSWKKTMTALAVVLLVLSCGREPVTGPETSASRVDGHVELGVLTWNVYVGARISDLLLVDDPNLIPFEVANIVGQVVANDFAQRADAMADQIARTRPEVIALQEMSLFRMQSPGDFLLGNPVPAQTPFLNYLAMLDQALTDRGLAYDFAAATENFDIELPMVNFATGGLDDVRLGDFDVILVKRGVPFTNPRRGNFAAFLPIDLGGVTIAKPSGWVSVDVTFGGRTYRVVNTHLEAADIAPGVVDPALAALQAAQLQELMGVLDASPYPVILTGDLNSAADGSSTTSYQDLIDAGFLDAWIAGAGGPGYTSNQAPDLRNAESELFHRIDFVLGRTRAGGPPDGWPGPVRAERVGEEQTDRTVDGLWPSDHAGVFVILGLPAR